MTKEDIEIAKYHLYDGMSKLQNIQEKGFSSYAPQYYLQLSKIIGYYAHFQRITLPATSKWDRFLNDPRFRIRYQLQGFDDDQFVSRFNHALKRYSSIEAIIRLTLYTLEKLGGFEINGWIIRKQLNPKNSHQ